MKNNIVVIMSVYKNDQISELEECLNSLYNQTYKYFDIYIQLDGEVCPDIVNYLTEEMQNSKIKLLNKRMENKGLAYSLNELLSIAFEHNYKYFVRMDADDICVSDKIEKQFNYMERNLDVDICGGFIEEFNVDTGEKQVVRYPEYSEAILQGMQRRNSVAHVTTFMRKSFFEKAGIYNVNKMNEDLDLWIRGFENNCKFYNIQGILVKVRTSNSFFNRRKNIKRAIEVMNLKIKATNLFGFGIRGYVYAIAHFLLFMLPSNIKQFIYKNMR